MGDVHAHGGGHVVLDVSDGHATGIETDDHVVDVGQPAGSFGHHCRQEGSVTVPGNSDIDRSVVRIDPLGVGTVTGIVLTSGFLAVPVTVLVAEVGIHLGVEAAVDRGLEQAPDEIVGIRCGGAELVDQFRHLRIGQQLFLDRFDLCGVFWVSSCHGSHSGSSPWCEGNPSHTNHLTPSFRNLNHYILRSLIHSGQLQTRINAL